MSAGLVAVDVCGAGWAGGAVLVRLSMSAGLVAVDVCRAGWAQKENIGRVSGVGWLSMSAGLVAVDVCRAGWAGGASPYLERPAPV